MFGKKAVDDEIFCKQQRQMEYAAKEIAKDGIFGKQQL